jgi:hypothetical protein
MFIIDRFEGDWAVIEFNNSTFNFPKWLLPKTAKEGDVLNVSITVDKEATRKRRTDSDFLLDDFFDE